MPVTLALPTCTPRPRGLLLQEARQSRGKRGVSHVTPFERRPVDPRKQKRRVGETAENTIGLSQQDGLKMPNQDPMETSSLFALSEIRQRMKEKKNGALKTTKMNASIAAKIRTKAINNSSIIKVTLKQNNKALALALNVAKREAQKLTKEKMLLQKEVKLGDFEKARLRQKLSAVANFFVRMRHKHNEYIEELQQFMNSHLQDIIEPGSPSESTSCSLLLSDGRLGTADTTDSPDDDNRPVRMAPKPMRIPLFLDNNGKCDKRTGNVAPARQSVLPLKIPALDVDDPLKREADPAVKKSSSTCVIDEPLASKERNGQHSSEADGTALALDLGAIFGGDPSSIPQSSRSCSLSMPNNNNLGQHTEMTRSYSDQTVVSLGHVTERRKRTTGFSASFKDLSWMEPSDNGPLVGLEPPKEMESAESSQLGELVMLKAPNESHEKIKANEAKALKKISMGTTGRVSSTSKSKGRLDNCNKGEVPNTTQPKAQGSNQMIVSKSTEVSAQVDRLEKVQPLNSCGQKERQNSRSLYTTVGPSTIHAASPCRNVEVASQCFGKTEGCGKMSVIDLALPQTGCASLIQEPKNKAPVLKSDPLSQSQRPESLSLLGSPPPAFPVLLDDAFSDGECRKFCKTIPKIWGFSTVQESSSSCLEKTCRGIRSQVTDLMKEDSKPKANKKTHAKKNVMDLTTDLHYMAKAAKGQKSPASSCAFPKNSAVFNTNDAKLVPSSRQEKTMQEAPAESSPNTSPHLNENKILKDLTNAAQSLCHSTFLEELPIRRGKRERKPVTYEEPKLNRKLRRGDPFANSDFFSCPIYKTRKKKMTKSEGIS
ncbi:shugoshin 2 [Eublepharis macularius]|uniref:Shugoshin 2 n=1 Tax=Eublepharis macularius TaxID=481883 RepID=A0AA97KG83_EUBMA|nr:shugoshin 2 [Eublepharis macularius]